MWFFRSVLFLPGGQVKIYLWGFSVAFTWKGPRSGRKASGGSNPGPRESLQVRGLRAPLDQLWDPRPTLLLVRVSVSWFIKHQEHHLLRAPVVRTKSMGCVWKQSFKSKFKKINKCKAFSPDSRTKKANELESEIKGTCGWEDMYTWDTSCCFPKLLSPRFYSWWKFLKSVMTT